jgi:alanine racemase
MLAPMDEATSPPRRGQGTARDASPDAARADPGTSRSELTIDRDALRANLRRLRAILGPTELWAVVKADAYGHGATAVAETALAEGGAALCVATVAEGLELRAVQPGARIVVLSPAASGEV